MRAVILGCGEVGLHLAQALTRSGVEVVMVDRDPSALAVAEDRVDAMTMLGDATHWSVLQRAGVERASLAAAVTGSDAINLVAAGIAAQVGALRTVARADDRGLYRSEAAVERDVLGVSFSLCVSRLIAHELLALLRARRADHIADFAAHGIRACIVRITDDSPLAGQRASQLQHNAAAVARALIRDGVLRPLNEIPRVEPGDRLVLAGEPRGLARVQYELVDALHEPRTVIIGGGDVGMQLARDLRVTERQVLIIERDRERCRVLSEELPDVSIIAGDGTSIALLRDQQVESADAVLATTRSDDANLMASLLARDLGVPNTFAVVHRHGYADVYQHLGVTGTIGPHDAIARMLQSLLPRDGGILQRQHLPDCSHELVEYLLDAQLPKGLRLCDLHLPPACEVLALAREHTSQPLTPRMPLCSLDQLVIAQPHHASRDVVKRIARLARGGA